MTTNDANTTAAAGPQLHQGGCHCGAVRFEARLELAKGGSKCNCSICRKTAFFSTLVKPADFRLLQGKDSLGSYQFGHNVGHHYFCKQCGVRSFGSSDIEMLGGLNYSVNLNCLDDVSLTDLPVVYWDGKNNNWQAGPSTTPVDGGAR